MNNTKNKLKTKKKIFKKKGGFVNPSIDGKIKRLLKFTRFI